MPYAAIESYLESSGISYTFVRASFFNLSTTHLADIRDRDEIMVPAGGGATAFVDAQDVGEVAAILSAELGRPIRYRRPGLLRYCWHARRSMPLPMVTAAIYTTARLGLAADLTDDVRRVLGRDPISFAEFAHRESWA